MSEMIERVARAIFGETGGDPDVMIGMKGALPKWINDAARAAIEAMREPTERMWMKGHLADTGEPIDPQSALKIWQAMIDEALK